MKESVFLLFWLPARRFSPAQLDDATRSAGKKRRMSRAPRRSAPRVVPRRPGHPLREPVFDSQAGNLVESLDCGRAIPSGGRYRGPASRFLAIGLIAILTRISSDFVELGVVAKHAERLELLPSGRSGGKSRRSSATSLQIGHTLFQLFKRHDEHPRIVAGKTAKSAVGCPIIAGRPAMQKKSPGP